MSTTNWDTVTFSSDPNQVSGSGNNDWGAGMNGGQGLRKRHSTSVYTIDLVKILKFFKGMDFVFMKMDIEGAEYAVLEHLQNANVLCSEYLNMINIEFHKRGTRQYRSQCEKESTLFLNMDDEKYLLDRKKLPSVESASFFLDEIRMEDYDAYIP